MVSWSFFKRTRPVFKRTRPFCKKGGIPPLLAFRGPKSALWGPEWVLPGPCEKPFINISKWEVFWRLKTGKVHFWPKKTGIPPRNRNFTKKLPELLFSRKGGDTHETLPFLLQIDVFTRICTSRRSQNHQIGWNLVNSTKFLWNSWKFVKFLEILGNSSLF